MSGINLLPWREELRKVNNNVFFALASASIVLSLILVFSVNFLFQHEIDFEEQYIAGIQSEQKSIVNKMQEIQGVQKDKEDLLHRREIIQSLQADRLLMVHFLDTLPRITPEGVVFNSIECRGEQITILGTTQAPTSISMLVKNLEDKRWGNVFTNIKINEMALDKNQTGVGFILEFTLAEPK